MNNEIKIIKSNHSVVIIKNGVIVKEQFAIDDEILDYIINLQKEVRINNDLIPYFKNKEKSLKKQITNLQKEKDYYFKKNNELSTLNTSLRSDRDNYKSRTEKAVEYINNNLLYSEDFDYDEEDNLVWQGARCDTQSEDLLNILNGRSDE